MARAHDPAAFQLALIEFAAVVRAHVLDRVDRARHVAEQDGVAADLDAPGRSGGDLGEFGDGLACS